jgi:hypothetical protein
MALKHSARMTNVPQLDVPDIFVEDEEDRARTAEAAAGVVVGGESSAADATTASGAEQQQQHQPSGTLLHAGYMSARNRPISAWTSGRLTHDDMDESPYMQDLDPQQAAHQRQKSQHHRSAPSRSRDEMPLPTPPQGWQLQESQVQTTARSRQSLTNAPLTTAATTALPPGQHPLSIPPRQRQGRSSDEQQQLHEPLSPGHRTNASAFSFELHEPPDEGLGEDRDTSTLGPNQVREMLDDSVWLQSIRRSATIRRSAWNGYR